MRRALFSVVARLALIAHRDFGGFVFRYAGPLPYGRAGRRRGAASSHGGGETGCAGYVCWQRPCSPLVGLRRTLRGRTSMAPRLSPAARRHGQLPDARAELPLGPRPARRPRSGGHRLAIRRAALHRELDPHARRISRAAADAGAERQRAVGHFPGDAAGRGDLAVHPQLSGAVAQARPDPDMVLSRAVDLRLEARRQIEHAGGVKGRSLGNV
jgi:hypothetical protein